MEGDNRSETYRECLRNHAASLGSYATDGCGEFTLDDASPGGLQCAACGCHRNFHRKVTYVAAHDGGGGGFGGRGGGGLLVCSGGGRSGGRDHHTRGEIMAAGELVEYGGGGGVMGRHEGGSRSPEMSERSGKMKRFRSKFTAEQKEKMLGFAEKLGWKMQRKDQEDEIERFCRSVGVTRQVFKVWMHNHKNSSSTSSTTSASTGNASSLTTQ